MPLKNLLLKIQPYAAAIAAGGSIAFLTFLVRFIRLFREAQDEQLKAVKEQKEITEERLRFAGEKLEHQIHLYEQEKVDLEKRLATALADAPASVDALVASRGHVDVSNDIRTILPGLLHAISELRQHLDRVTLRSGDDAVFSLNLAKASSATGDWIGAAQGYRAYLALRPNDWKVHFLLAIALANSRGDEATNLGALRALNEAISLAPPDLDANLRARLHAYRGAAHKRLKRLDEAENELLFARKFATADYEKSDIAYNLAGVYAMMRRRDAMLHELRKLTKRPEWLQTVSSRRVYFENYLDDKEFRNLVHGQGHNT